MPRVYVSVGSNVDREANVRAAARALRGHYGELQVSAVYESQAVGFDGNDFYNLVIGFDTEERPRAIAATLKSIEDGQGRSRAAPRFSDRTLDLDLILYGDLVVREEGLSLPRPEVLEHAFVLGPLAEIAGNEIHPVADKTYAELWAAFEASGQSLRRVDFQFEPGV